MKITFDLPDTAMLDAGGIADSFAETYNRPERVPSDYKPEVDGKPNPVAAPVGFANGTVPNPVSKVEFTIAQVQRFVDETWQPYANKRTKLANDLAVAAAVKSQAQAVSAATKVTVE